MQIRRVKYTYIMMEYTYIVLSSCLEIGELLCLTPRVHAGTRTCVRVYKLWQNGNAIVKIPVQHNGEDYDI